MMPIPGPQDIQADLQRIINKASEIDHYYERIRNGALRTTHAERMNLYDAEYLRALADGVVSSITARYEDYKYIAEPRERKAP